MRHPRTTQQQHQRPALAARQHSGPEASVAQQRARAHVSTCALMRVQCLNMQTHAVPIDLCTRTCTKRFTAAWKDSVLLASNTKAATSALREQSMHRVLRDHCKHTLGSRTLSIMHARTKKCVQAYTHDILKTQLNTHMHTHVHRYTHAPAQKHTRTNLHIHANAHTLQILMQMRMHTSTRAQPLHALGQVQFGH